MGAEQEDEGAHAEQVNHAVDEVVVATHGPREQRDLRSELDGIEGDDDPVELVPDDGQIDVEQMPGDVGAEDQYGKAREGKQPQEEDGAGDGVGIGVARTVLWNGMCLG